MTKEDVVREIDRAYQLLKLDQEHRARTKTWSVTVWTVVMVTLAIRQQKLDKGDALLITLAPILLFWMMELIYGINSKIHTEFIQKLELRLAHDAFDVVQPESCYVFCNYISKTPKEKVINFLIPALLMETIALFYISLIGLSVGIWWFVL
jgi:hypothetical protein